MKMHLDTSPSNLVTDYGENYICVNSERYSESLVVSKDQLATSWQKENVAEMTIADFASIVSNKPEIIILGTGKSHCFPSQQLMAELFAQGCALEVMNTSAACRTYNVLVSEYRDVTAILLQIRS